MFQEFSQRYADPTESLGFETREPRLQDTKNRQNSVDFDPENEDTEAIRAEWFSKLTATLDKVMEDYNWAIKNGIAKEQARAFLPEGLTRSRMYMTGSLRSWYHYYQLRSGNGTQKEHRIVAEQCWDILKGEFPATAEALKLIEEEKNG